MKLDLDIESFWRDEDRSHEDNCFAKSNPQVALGIRKYMPRTRIDGQLAPFTFMRNVEEDIIAEVKRDCEMAKEGDLRGLNLTTAGSINNGSLLTSMRVVMAAIQNFGRY